MKFHAETIIDSRCRCFYQIRLLVKWISNQYHLQPAFLILWIRWDLYILLVCIYVWSVQRQPILFYISHKTLHYRFLVGYKNMIYFKSYRHISWKLFQQIANKFRNQWMKMYWEHRWMNLPLSVQLTLFFLPRHKFVHNQRNGNNNKENWITHMNRVKLVHTQKKYSLTGHNSHKWTTYDEHLYIIFMIWNGGDSNWDLKDVNCVPSHQSMYSFFCSIFFLRFFSLFRRNYVWTSFSMGSIVNMRSHEFPFTQSNLWFYRLILMLNDHAQKRIRSY